MIFSNEHKGKNKAWGVTLAGGSPSPTPEGTPWGAAAGWPGRRCSRAPRRGTAAAPGTPPLGWPAPWRGRRGRRFATRRQGPGADGVQHLLKNSGAGAVTQKWHREQPTA